MLCVFICTSKHTHTHTHTHTRTHTRTHTHTHARTHARTHTHTHAHTHTHRVLVTIYNLGVTGSAFDNCFNSAVGSGNTLVVRFRSKRALRLTLNVSLADMYDMNIGPASSIGDENRDPTLRPIILGNWPRELSVCMIYSRVLPSSMNVGGSSVVRTIQTSHSFRGDMLSGMA